MTQTQVQEFPQSVSRNILTAFFLVVLSLLATHHRIGFGDYTMSITSFASVVFVMICFSALGQKSLRERFKKAVNTRLFTLTAISFFALLLSTIFKGTLHGWGVFVEWFFIPAIFAWCAHETLISTPDAKTKMLRGLLALSGIASITALIFALFGVLTYDYRLSGLWPSPNHLGLFLVPLILLCLPLVHARGKMHSLPLAIVMSGFAAVLLTQSLAACSLLLFGILVYSALASNARVSARRLFALVLIFVLATSAVTTFLLSDRIESFFANIERSSLASRITILDVSSHILREHPIIPSVESFQNAYLSRQSFYPPYLEWAVPTPHNLYLMLWFTGGWLFLLLSLLVFSWILFSGCRNYRSARSSSTLAALIALSVVLLHGFVDTPYFRIDLAYLFVIGTIFMLHKK